MRIHLLLFIALLISGCAAGTKDDAGAADTAEESNTPSLAGTCPRGNVNDTYPGSCGLYVDENSNKICDRSE